MSSDLAAPWVLSSDIPDVPSCVSLPLLCVSAEFEKVDDGTVKLLVPKLIYVAVNCVFLGMGLWKCGKMGLLPTTSADYVSYLGSRPPVEYSTAPVTWA